MLQGVDEGNMILFIPLSASTTSGSGFLNTIASRLNPTSDGLGVVDKDTKKFKTLTIPTGQDWSLTNVVSAKDPYFTWVDSPLEQYTIIDNPFIKHIGWRAKAGPQVIYFQNPSPVTAADIASLTAAVGAVMPGDVLSKVLDPLYSPGEISCPSPAPKFKAPKLKMSGLSENVLFVLYILAVFLGLVVAVALILSPDSYVYRMAKGIAAWFESGPKVRGV
jgi:hypothetical protein